MSLILKPTNGLTVSAFLDENGTLLIGHNFEPTAIWDECGADRLPVLLVSFNNDFKQAVVAYSLEELRTLIATTVHHIGIYFVRIVDLLPHVERLEAKLKELYRHSNRNNRVGRFALPFDEIEHQTPFARAILDKVFIVRAEAIYHAKEISYIAYSDLFHEIQIGMAPPDYLWTATHDQDGKIVDLKADLMKATRRE